MHDSPNFDQTALDFWEFICASIELRGNAFALIERSGGRVVALTPIPADVMSVRRTPAGALEYSWTLEGKGFRETDRSVLHIRGFGGNPLGGLSTLQFGRHASVGYAKAIRSDSEGDKAKKTAAFLDALRTA